MYINSTGFYIPEERVHNDHFLNLNGLTDEWILHNAQEYARAQKLLQTKDTTQWD